MDSKMAEAERRMEEALRTGAEWLDLGDPELDQLPARIGELRQLRRLALGWMALSEVGELKGDFWRQSPGFADLTPLAGLLSAGREPLRPSGWCRSFFPTLGFGEPNSGAAAAAGVAG